MPPPHRPIDMNPSYPYYADAATWFNQLEPGFGSSMAASANSPIPNGALGTGLEKASSFSQRSLQVIRADHRSRLGRMAWSNSMPISTSCPKRLGLDA